MPDILFISLHDRWTDTGVPAVVDQFMRFGGDRLKTIVLAPESDTPACDPAYPAAVLHCPADALNRESGTFDLSALFGRRARARRQIMQALLPHLDGVRMVLLAQPLLLTWLIEPLKRHPSCSVALLAQGDALGTLITTAASRRRKRRLRRVDHVFAASEFLKGLLIKKAGFHAHQVTLTPVGTALDPTFPFPAADRTRVRQALGIPEDARVVVCSGPLTEQAGTDLVIEAWPEIERAVPDAWLVMMGRGPEQIECAAAASDMRRVVCRSSVTDLEKAEILSASDLYLRPNRRQTGGKDVSAGLAFLEAAMCGLPAISGMTGAAPDMVADGETGCVIDSTSTECIAVATIRLLAAPRDRQRMSVAARAFAETRRGPAMTQALIAEIDRELLR